MFQQQIEGASDREEFLGGLMDFETKIASTEATMEALKKNASVNTPGVKSTRSGALPSARLRLDRTATHCY